MRPNWPTAATLACRPDLWLASPIHAAVPAPLHTTRSSPSHGASPPALPASSGNGCLRCRIGLDKCGGHGVFIWIEANDTAANMRRSGSKGSRKPIRLESGGKQPKRTCPRRARTRKSGMIHTDDLTMREMTNVLWHRFILCKMALCNHCKSNLRCCFTPCFFYVQKQLSCAPGSAG